MARLRNRDWDMHGSDGTGPYPIETVKANILMDIRDELKKLNLLLHCHNVIRGFRALSKIAARDERSFKRRVAEASRKRVATEGKRRGR